MSATGEKKEKGPADPKQAYSLREEELEQVRKRLADNQLEEGDREIIDRALTVLIVVMKRLESAKIGIHRLRKLLFGKRTEKEKHPPQDGPQSGPPAASGTSSPGGLPGPEPVSAATTEESGAGMESPDPPPAKKKVKGHGRKPASAYTQAEVVACPLCGLAEGDRCPACGRGKMRRLKPVVEIRLIGNPPVSARRYEQERLRCDTCGKTVTAPLPAEAGSQKYSPSAQASVAILKYSGGMAFHRLSGLEQFQGVPLAASTQWHMVEEAANLLFPVYRELRRQAAGGSLLFIDDTHALILELLKKGARSEEPSTRQGIFTTGILSRFEEHWVALYLSGTKHAGENIRELLALRPPDLPRPIQMSDALSRNLLASPLVVLVLCLVHARRNFFEIRDFYPDACQKVLETIKAVYQLEANIQKQKLGPAERLKQHQQISLPLLEDLRHWLSGQLADKQIEPNSALGKAANYFLKHWQGLTGFCRIAGAPLDNNPAERVLKLAILWRKNSYFFKTEHGAAVGGILMSLIQTARLARANPFHFLETLLAHPQEVKKAPVLWLPWNYQAQLAS
jgi:transposase